MFILFDMTNCQALAAHDSYIGVAALAYIQYANVDTLICRGGNEDKDYAQLLAKEMRTIANKMGGEIPHAVFGGCIKKFRQLVEGAEWLRLPFSAEQLYRQAASIDPTDGRPYAITNGDEPERLTTWHSEPQRNRPRHECPYWINFTNAEPPVQLTDGYFAGAPWNAGGEGGTLRTRASRAFTTTHATESDMATAAKKAATNTPAKKAPAAPAAKKAPAAPAAAKTEKAAKAPAAPKAAKAAAAPKVERVVQNGVTRPKAGTAGDKIWSAADTISAKKKSPASFEEVNKALGETVNEASQRAGYQHWRKFNGLKGRLAAAE